MEFNEQCSQSDFSHLRPLPEIAPPAGFIGRDIYESPFLDPTLRPVEDVPPITPGIQRELGSVALPCSGEIIQASNESSDEASASDTPITPGDDIEPMYEPKTDVSRSEQREVGKPDAITPLSIPTPPREVVADKKATVPEGDPTSEPVRDQPREQNEPVSPFRPLPGKELATQDPPRFTCISPAEQLRSGDFKYDSPDAPGVAPGDSRGMLRAVTRSYFEGRPEQELQIVDRYNRLTERDPELPAEPRATIVVPVAIHDEERATVDKTLSVLADQAGIEQDEVLLYANTPDNCTPQEQTTARDKLDALVRDFRADHPQVTLRSVMQTYEARGWTMGRVRHDMMDVIAYDAFMRNFGGVDHPVIMFDADIEGMTPNAVERLADVMRAPDSPHTQAHLRTFFLFGEDTPTEDGKMSDTRRLAIFQEIRRRQYVRMQNRLKEDKSVGWNLYKSKYPEEWGTVNALGPYLMANGYDIRGPSREHALGENPDLKKKLKGSVDEISQVMRYAKPDIGGQMATYSHYIDATVRSSGRRPEDFLRTYIYSDDDVRHMAGVIQYNRQGIPYGEFSHTEDLRSSPRYSPRFLSNRQARKIMSYIMEPPTVSSPDSDAEVPMPDPEPLLRKLDLWKYWENT